MGGDRANPAAGLSRDPALSSPRLPNARMLLHGYCQRTLSSSQWSVRRCATVLGTRAAWEVTSGNYLRLSLLGGNTAASDTPELLTFAQAGQRLGVGVITARRPLPGGARRAASTDTGGVVR